MNGSTAPATTAKTSWIRRLRGGPATALVVLGAFVLVLGVVAGYVNRTVLDPQTFAVNVDELRQVDQVSRALGHQMTDQLVAQNPNLVAIRPLVDEVATSVAGSAVLSPPTRLAASTFMESTTQRHPQNVVLRIADAGAVLAAAVQRLAPEGTVTADPAEVSLQLSLVGGQSWASRPLRVAAAIRLAAWLFPLTGVALMGLGVYASTRRRRATFIAGASVLGVTGLLAVLLVVGGVWAWSQDDSQVSGALVRYGWRVFVSPLWWLVAGLLLLGALVSASAASLLPEGDPSRLFGRVRLAVSRRPSHAAVAFVRSLALMVVGVLAIVRPLVAAEVIGFMVGLWLLLYGLAELAALTDGGPSRQWRPFRRLSAGTAAGGTAAGGTTAVGTATPVGRGRRPTAAGVRTVVAVGATLAALTGFVVWAAAPASPVVVGPVAGAGEVCNGYAALCARRFTDVAYAATHNSMSSATDRTWFIPEQGVPIPSQLDNRIHALLIDVWPGQQRADGRVATDPAAYAEAKAVADEEFGAETVAAGLRVFEAVASPRVVGVSSPFMCHGLCELGATNFTDSMTSVKGWLDTHPDEVLSIIIEDHLSADRIAAVLHQVGLAAYAYTPTPGAAWPTLHEMITSGRRLVVMLEAGNGGTTDPWLVNAFADFVQDTPYTFPTQESFSCAANRGRPDAPLLLVNHWLAGFSSLVTDARTVNVAAVLGDRAEQCRSQRRLPNYLAVNYADIGDVVEVVDRLNGVA